MYYLTFAYGAPRVVEGMILHTYSRGGEPWCVVSSLYSHVEAGRVIKAVEHFEKMKLEYVQLAFKGDTVDPWADYKRRGLRA